MKRLISAFIFLGFGEKGKEEIIEIRKLVIKET